MAMAALAMTLPACDKGGDFDDGRRPGEVATMSVSQLEQALREVKPDMREGVQQTIRCRRIKAKAEGRAYNVDVERIRAISAEYAKDKTISDC